MLSTEAEQLRAYVLLHDWQARNLDMNGSCDFVPPIHSRQPERLRCSFFWFPEMSESSVLHCCNRIAWFEQGCTLKLRTSGNVRADLPVAYELMRDQC